MWSCSYRPNSGPITFDVPILLSLLQRPSMQAPSPPQQEMPQQRLDIGAVKLWNYNKSVHELTIGVRRCVLAMDDLTLFDGEVERACGNPAFDYGMRVQCATRGAHAPPSLGATLHPSDAAHLYVFIETNRTLFGVWYSGEIRIRLCWKLKRNSSGKLLFTLYTESTLVFSQAMKILI